MPFYYYIYFSAALLLLVIFIRYFILSRTNLSVTLYMKARLNENAGEYEEAISQYEAALSEVNKIRFHSGLKTQIIEKLKVLNSFTAYHDTLHLKRKPSVL